MCLLRSWRTFPFRSASASRKHLTCSVHAPQRRATSFTACRSSMRATAFMPIPASSPVTMLSWTTVHGHCATTKWHRFARTAFSSIEIVCRKSGTPVLCADRRYPFAVHRHFRRRQSYQGDLHRRRSGRQRQCGISYAGGFPAGSCGSGSCTDRNTICRFHHHTNTCGSDQGTGSCACRSRGK